MNPMQLVKSKLRNVKPSNEGFTALCPAHGDKHNSLCLAVGDDGRVLLDCKAGCSVEAVIAKLGLSMSDLFMPRRVQNRSFLKRRGEGGSTIPSNNSATVQQSQVITGCTLVAYAEAKHLPINFLKQVGLSQITYNGAPAVRIPYYGAGGTDAEVAIRFRLAVEKSPEADNRFKWRTGSRVIPYGLWKLPDARKLGYVVIVEGESDFQTLLFHKQPALGIPGANTWKEEWADYLDEVPTIYVVVEPDRGGDAVRKWLSKSRIRDRVRLIELGALKDPSGLYISNPEGFDSAWKAALDGAVPWTELAQVEAESKVKVAWDECKHLASAPDILTRFAEALTARGIAGEVRAAKLIYLTIVSRFLARPVSVAVKGPSSAGKSYLAEQVLAFFPDRAFYALSAMSERALAYSDEPLMHRIMVIYEAAGLTGDFASYLMRSLLSEGRVRYETVEKTKDGLKSRLIEREGPTGLIVTTTAINLHPENETRLLSIPVTDTPEQTRNVLIALARGRGKGDRNGGHGSVNLSDWHALHEWLEGSEHRVSIPYAEKLAHLVPTVAVRLRRDFGMILSLISAHAILHQATRERDSEGRIIASIADYIAVRDLVVDLVAESVDATVSAVTKETVRAIAEMCNAGAETVSVSHLAAHLKLDKSVVSRRAKSCIEHGYVRNEETRQGRPYKLKLGEPLPEEQEILPHPDLLATNEPEDGCCSVAVLQEGISLPPPPAPISPSADAGSRATSWQCGISGEQCRLCQGVPCKGSIEWSPNGDDKLYSL